MKSNSVRLRLMALTIAFLIPLLLFLIFNHVYYSHLTQRRTAEAGADLIALYLNLTDARVEEISDMLGLFAATNQNLRLLNSADADNRQFAAIQLQAYMASLISKYTAADSLFVCVERYGYYGYVFGGNSTYRLRKIQQEYLERNIFYGGDTGIPRWQSVRLDGEAYLLWTFYSNGACVGAWVNMEELRKPLETIPNSDKAQFVFTDLHDRPLTNARFVEDTGLELRLTDGIYSRSGAPQPYILTGAQSATGGYRLYMAFPEKSIIENLDALQMIIFIISACAFLLIPAMLHLFRRNLLHPLDTLTAAVNEVQNGNLDHRIGMVQVPDEFLKINSAFDKMTVQLKDYKIKEYEETLAKQKLTLSYLQMQIRPHFFLNALTTVSNLAKTGQGGQMERFVRYLAEYMRYRFYSNINMVPLREELAHLENYLSMQEISYNGTLSYFFDISPDAAPSLIPPFTLHNFAENIIKHAMESRDRIAIYIRAVVSQGMLEIIIEDDGAGLTPQALEQLNDPDFEPCEGKNTGIWNIRQTLGILFGNKAGVVVEPSELAGTRVTVTLPAAILRERGKPDENIDF